MTLRLRFWVTHPTEPAAPRRLLARGTETLRARLRCPPQDRSAKELALADIATVEAVNHFLADTCLSDQNHRFAIPSQPRAAPFRDVCGACGASRGVVGYAVGGTSTSSTREGLDAMECEVSRNDLERFFLELVPRLETARVLDRELDRQLARRFNVLDYLRTDELGLSRVVADLLNPEGNHGQGAVFLQLLLNKVGFKVDGKIDSSRVDVELTIKVKDRRRRLDVAVRIDERHCLAIENKPYAGDQPDQVKDYLEWLEKYDKHMLIYLSPTGEGPGKHSIGNADLEKPKQHYDPRPFVIMPYHGVAAPDDGFDRFRLPFSLADWLADCRRHCDVDRLCWFLREAETFCQRKFGGNTMTDAEDSAIKEFVLGDDRNVKIAFAVHESWSKIRSEICRKFLETVRRNLREDMESHWPEIKICAEYSEERYGSGIHAHLNPWEHRIYLQAQGTGANNWGIGVCSPLPFSDMEDEDQLRRKCLEEALGEAFAAKGRRGRVTPDYPWWEVEDSYRRYWDPLIPVIDRESRDNGGEVTDYFVKKFTEIAKIAIPIIESIEGGESEQTRKNYGNRRPEGQDHG